MGMVLIVDDAETSAAALEVACASIPGVRVAAVRSAVEAVRVLDEPSEPVAAVITDIRMPKMDGFELIQFLRAQEKYALTPILVVTGDTDPDTPGRALRLGANACFHKPFSPREVRRTLEGLLHATHA